MRGTDERKRQFRPILWMIALGLACGLLLLFTARFFEHRRRTSELWVDGNGFRDRKSAEVFSLTELEKIIEKESRINMIWKHYNVSVRDAKGEVLGFRLAAIGYNREQRSLVHLIIDPNFKTRSNPPTQYDIYTPVSPADLAQLVQSQGRVDDIRKVVPGVTMRTRVVPDGEKYDETTLP